MLFYGKPKSHLDKQDTRQLNMTIQPDINFSTENPSSRMEANAHSPPASPFTSRWSYSPSEQSGHIARPQQGGHIAHPQKGGHIACSQQSGHIARPQQGGHIARPQQGGRIARPQQGGHIARPQKSCHIARPQGGHLARPQQDGHIARPQQGGHIARPQQGCYIARPQQGGHIACSQQFDHIARPQQGGHKARPQEGGLRLSRTVFVGDFSPFALTTIGGVGGTVASESALRSAGTVQSRVRAPTPAPRPDGGPQSLRSPFCGVAVHKKPNQTLITIKKTKTAMASSISRKKNKLSLSAKHISVKQAPSSYVPDQTIGSEFCFLCVMRGFGDTVASESALGSAGTLLSRVRAPAGTLA
ncbi:transglutaminase [Plakobranchus ocellatus]|uniref:Transglutaminase n=1 Tax=Plakobranchus ocellatus TaxID=259542 RepID=A0AAV4CL76_9GAST|nr:transglutaminase [Plakobranchus ocellatus]